MAGAERPGEAQGRTNGGSTARFCATARCGLTSCKLIMTERGRRKGLPSLRVRLRIHDFCTRRMCVITKSEPA